MYALSKKFFTLSKDLGGHSHGLGVAAAAPLRAHATSSATAAAAAARASWRRRRAWTVLRAAKAGAGEAPAPCGRAYAAPGRRGGRDGKGCRDGKPGASRVSGAGGGRKLAVEPMRRVRGVLGGRLTRPAARVERRRARRRARTAARTPARASPLWRTRESQLPLITSSRAKPTPCGSARPVRAACCKLRLVTGRAPMGRNGRDGRRPACAAPAASRGPSWRVGHPCAARRRRRPSPPRTAGRRRSSRTLSTQQRLPPRRQRAAAVRDALHAAPVDEHKVGARAHLHRAGVAMELLEPG